MSNIPTAEEFANNIYQEYPVSKEIHSLMIEFTKLHVEAALKAASENADADFTYLGDDLREIGAEYIEVYVITSSILNAYPLSNIK